MRNGSGRPLRRCWNIERSRRFSRSWPIPITPRSRRPRQWLFNDPKSPWVPILPEARGEQTPGFQNLFASPLIVVAGFRQGVLTGLADKTPLGTVEKIDDRSIQRKFTTAHSTNYSSSNLDLEGIAVGVDYPFRRCDYLASKLSELEGSPQIDLFWPEARRDEAVAACVAFLKRYGASFSRQGPARRARLPGPQGAPEVPDPRQAGDPRGRRLGPGDLLARRTGRSAAGEHARVPCSRQDGSRSRTLRGLDRPGRHPSTASTTPTATSGRPRRSARGMTGNASTASSATTSSRGPRPPRSSSPASSALGEPQGGLDARTRAGRAAHDRVRPGPTDPGGAAHPQPARCRSLKPDGVRPTRARRQARAAERGQPVALALGIAGGESELQSP